MIGYGTSSALGGSGNELFAEEPDTAMALIAGEVEACSRMDGLPIAAAKDGVVAELGSFYAKETRKILLVFDVPAVAALGLVTIATLEFSYVELPTLKKHSVFVPIQVNVVPGRGPNAGSGSAYRTALPTGAASEAAYLSSGDSEAALLEIGASQEVMKKALAEDLPSSLAADIAEEALSRPN